MCFKGTYAYEVQVGCLVVQWFYETPPHHARIHCWRDFYTNSRSYLRYAPWGTTVR